MVEFAVPSIFATAHGDAETRMRAEKARPLGWLTKPYGPESLLVIVAAALSKLRIKR